MSGVGPFWSGKNGGGRLPPIERWRAAGDDLTSGKKIEGPSNPAPWGGGRNRIKKTPRRGGGIAGGKLSIQGSQPGPIAEEEPETTIIS